LNQRFDTLEVNQHQLMDALGMSIHRTPSLRLSIYVLFCVDVKERNIMAIMASLHRHITEQPGEDRKHAFLTHSLQLLTTISGQQVDLQSWTITSYEVKFVRLIGRGGLYGLSDIITMQLNRLIFH
jgi:hypothetical protein